MGKKLECKIEGIPCKFKVEAEDMSDDEFFRIAQEHMKRAHNRELSDEEIRRVCKLKENRFTIIELPEVPPRR